MWVEMQQLEAAMGGGGLLPQMYYSPTFLKGDVGII